MQKPNNVPIGKKAIPVSIVVGDNGQEIVTYQLVNDYNPLSVINTGLVYGGILSLVFLAYSWVIFRI